ncbi:hypothetical protein D3C75_671420 [compost metagenome]
MPGKTALQLQCIGKIIGRWCQAVRQIKGFLPIVDLEQRRVQRLVNGQADTVARIVRIKHYRIGCYTDNQASSILRPFARRRLL